MVHTDFRVYSGNWYQEINLIFLICQDHVRSGVLEFIQPISSYIFDVFHSMEELVLWNPFIGTTLGTEGSSLPIGVILIGMKWRPELDGITLRKEVIYTYMNLAFIINYGKIYPLLKQT